MTYGGHNGTYVGSAGFWDGGQFSGSPQSRYFERSTGSVATLADSTDFRFSGNDPFMFWTTFTEVERFLPGDGAWRVRCQL